MWPPAGGCALPGSCSGRPYQPGTTSLRAAWHRGGTMYKVATSLGCHHSTTLSALLPLTWHLCPQPIPTACPLGCPQGTTAPQALAGEMAGQKEPDVGTHWGCIGDVQGTCPWLTLPTALWTPQCHTGCVCWTSLYAAAPAQPHQQSPELNPSSRGWLHWPCGSSRWVRTGVPVRLQPLHLLCGQLCGQCCG